MARNALFLNITPEDEKWAVSQDRFNCAVVRCVQREVPNALYVTADTKGIGFSIPEDGKDGVRYTFDPPPAELLESFDRTHTIPDELRTFSVVAREARPMKRVKRGQSSQNADRRQRREYRARTKSPIVKTTNRFLDAEAGE